MDYHKKYQKYKFKYLNLKNNFVKQSGGSDIKGDQLHCKIDKFNLQPEKIYSSTNLNNTGKIFSIVLYNKEPNPDAFISKRVPEYTYGVLYSISQVKKTFDNDIKIRLYTTDRLFVGTNTDNLLSEIEILKNKFPNWDYETMLSSSELSISRTGFSFRRDFIHAESLRQLCAGRQELRGRICPPSLACPQCRFVDRHR